MSNAGKVTPTTTSVSDPGFHPSFKAAYVGLIVGGIAACILGVVWWKGWVQNRWGWRKGGIRTGKLSLHEQYKLKERARAKKEAEAAEAQRNAEPGAGGDERVEDPEDVKNVQDTNTLPTLGAHAAV